MQDEKIARPEEMVGAWDDVELMRADPNLVVLMAIPDGFDAEEPLFMVSYFDRRRSALPRWIIDRKAA